MYHALNTSQAIIDFNLVGTFGFRLRMIRELVEMSRPKFADLLQTPPTTLKNYELGYRTTTFELLCRVFEYAERSDHAVLWIRYILLGKSTSSAPAELLAEQLKYQKLKTAQAA